MGSRVLGVRERLGVGGTQGEVGGCLGSRPVTTSLSGRHKWNNGDIDIGQSRGSEGDEQTPNGRAGNMRGR